MIRNPLFSIHILGVIGWIGVGFFQLYLGRRFLAERGSVLEAPLIRIIYSADIVVAVATLLVFATGIAMTILEGRGVFTPLWLGALQAIMLIVVAIVAFIMPMTMKLNRAIGALPPGPGEVTQDIRRNSSRGSGRCARWPSARCSWRSGGRDSDCDRNWVGCLDRRGYRSLQWQCSRQNQRFPVAAFLYSIGGRMFASSR